MNRFFFIPNARRCSIYDKKFRISKESIKWINVQKKCPNCIDELWIKNVEWFPTTKKNENFHQAKYGKKRQKKGEKKINNQSIYSKAILFYDDDDDYNQMCVCVCVSFSLSIYASKQTNKHPR